MNLNVRTWRLEVTDVVGLFAVHYVDARYAQEAIDHENNRGLIVLSCTAVK